MTMTTNATTKGESKGLAFFRWLVRSPRPTPFWRKRLDDMVEPAEPIEVGPTPRDDVLSNFANSVFMLAGGAIFISALAYLAGAIFLSPGFFEAGIAAPLGHWYASFCFATGQCNLGYLLAGTVVGVMVLVLAALIFLAGFGPALSDKEPVIVPDVGTEIVDALSVLDERLVRFRADMVLGGILPLSGEEQEEDEEDEALEVAKALPGFPMWLALAVLFWAIALATMGLLGPGRWVVGWEGPGTALLAVVAGMGLPTIVMQVLMSYDKWVRLQQVGATVPAPVPTPPALPAREAAPTTYTRPELTKDDQAKAGQLAVSLTGNKSTLQIRAAVAMVLLENQKLTREVNEHRAARGLEPLATHEVGK
jgi:hypothetical protein